MGLHLGDALKSGLAGHTGQPAVAAAGNENLLGVKDLLGGQCLAQLGGHTVKYHPDHFLRIPCLPGQRIFKILLVHT